MKHILLISGLAATLLMGCSKEEEEVPAPSAPTADGSVTAADPLAPAGSSASPGSSTPEAFDPAKFGPPPLPTADFGAADRPLADNGAAMNDLEYLNSILHRYNESRGSYSPEPEPQFKTEAEYQVYAAALKKLKEPITDLNELVKAKVIKAIPPAPAGKKYAVNPQTFKVEMVDATAQ